MSYEAERAIAKVATSGPWFAYLSLDHGWTVQHAGGWIARLLDAVKRPAKANATFIATFNPEFCLGLLRCRGCLRSIARCTCG